MLETIREYGSEQLSGHSEATAIGQRHAAYYLALAEEAAIALTGPEVVTGLARLDDEHDNLRAALRWARERGDRVSALRLAGALWRFWAQRGHLSEGRRWFTEAFALPGDAGKVPAATQVNWLAGAARLAMDQAAFDEAMGYSDQAVALAGEQGAPADQAAALNTRGLLARAMNHYADSVQAHEAALPLARAAADPGAVATALLGLAYAAMFTGDAPRASALAEESLTPARESRDPLIQAQVLFFLSWVASNGAGFERATALATEALGLFTTLGDTGGRAEALFVLGTVEMYSARYAEAAGFFTDSANTHRAHGAEPILARDLGGLGSALLNLGDLPRARAVLDESLEVARRYADPWSSAMSLMLLGHVDLAEGDATRAQAALAEAGSLFQATGNMVYLPWCLEGLAGLAAAQGEYGRAAELGGARDALRTQIGVFLPPVYPAGYNQALAAARAHLTPAAFDAARARAASNDTTADHRRRQRLEYSAARPLNQVVAGGISSTTSSRSSLASAGPAQPAVDRGGGRPGPTSSAAARRPRDAGAGRGRVHHTAGPGPQHRAEVHHVPSAAPGDERRDPDRAHLAVLPVHQPRAAHVPVADGVVADAGVDPGRVGRGHDDPDQGGVPGARAEKPVGGGHVEPEVTEQPAVPVSGRVGDGLDLGVRGQREERLGRQPGLAGHHGGPQVRHFRAEHPRARAGHGPGLVQRARGRRHGDHGRLAGAGRHAARRRRGGRRR